MASEKKILRKNNRRSSPKPYWNFLSHYPRFFFHQIIFRSISWVVFAILLIFLGKRYADTDILGKIYYFIFRSERDFRQCFLGQSDKILNYAFYLIGIIIILNLVSLLFNSYFWNKDRYIENNNFYLHQRTIFIVNSLIHIASAILLTFCLTNAITFLLALIFITFNSWNFFSSSPKKNPQTETFFSWKNEYVRKIALYSGLTILILPIVAGNIQDFVKESQTSSPEGFAKTFQELMRAFPLVGRIITAVTEVNFSFLHWIFLLWFGQNIISGRTKDFTDFWTAINGIERRVINFIHYYYYQESWALAKRAPIQLGDYSFLEDSPAFLGKGYLKGDLDVNDFARQNRQTVKHIEFCEKNVPESAKRNFLNYCLFNDFNTWEDCLKTKKLIKNRSSKNALIT